MTARVLDGRAVAKEVSAEVARAVAERLALGKSRPKLATVLIGDDPASATYVELKQRNAKSVGIESEDHRLAASITTEELLALVDRLNRDENVIIHLAEIPQPAPEQVAKGVRGASA